VGWKHLSKIVFEVSMGNSALSCCNGQKSVIFKLEEEMVQ